MANEITIRVTAQDDASKTFNNIEKNASGMSTAFKGIAAVVGSGAIAAGAGEMAQQFGEFTGAASGLNEALSKSNTIFKENGAEVSAWASQAAKDFGQSKEQALAAAGTFGNLFTQLGVGTGPAKDMSMAMTELASDFASFHNADISEVIVAQTAAFRGEYDALQRFVPTIKAATVEQKALAMTGKATTKELTEQEKALAVYQLMIEGAGEAMGDFDRTSGEFANTQRTLKAEMANLNAEMGTKTMPIIMGVIDVFKALPEPVQTAGFLLMQMGPALGQVAFGVMALVPALSALGPVIASLGMALLTPPVGFVVALVAAGVAVYIFRDQIWGAFKAIYEAVVGTLTQVVGWLTANWPIVATLISGPFLPLVALATDAFGVRSALIGALNAIVEVLSGFPAKVAGALGDMARMVGSAVKAGVNVAIDALNTVIRAWNNLEFKLDSGIPGIPDVNVGTPNLPTIPRLAAGLSFVPRDDFPAFLHRGEAVLTAQENRERQRGKRDGGNVNVNVYGPLTVNAQSQADAERSLGDMAYAAAAAMSRRGLPVYG